MTYRRVTPGTESGCLADPYLVGLSGTGAEPPHSSLYTPQTALDFGEVAVGQNSAIRLKFENRGPDMGCLGGQLEIVGASSSEFSVSTKGPINFCRIYDPGCLPPMPWFVAVPGAMVAVSMVVSRMTMLKAASRRTTLTGARRCPAVLFFSQAPKTRQVRKPAPVAELQHPDGEAHRRGDGTPG